MANHTTDEVYDKATSIETKIDKLSSQGVTADQFIAKVNEFNAKVGDLKTAIEKGPNDKATDLKTAVANLPFGKEVILALKADGWLSGAALFLNVLVTAATLRVLHDDLKKIRAEKKAGREGGNGNGSTPPGGGGRPANSGNAGTPSPSAPKPAEFTKTTEAVGRLKKAITELDRTLQPLTGQLKTVTASLRTLKSAADSAASAVTKLNSATQKTAGQMRSLATAAQGATTPLRTIKTASDQAEKSLTKTGKSAQTAGTNFTKYEAGTNKAAKGQDKMNKSMKGNLFGILMLALAPLIAKVIDMATQSKTMQKILKTAFEVIKSVIGNVMKAIGPIMKTAADLIKKIWDGIKTAISTVVQAVATVIRTYFNIWKTIITTVLNAIKSVVSGVWNGIKAVITPVVNWVKSVIPNAFQAVKDKLTSAWNGLKDIAGRAFDGIKNAVKAPINAVIGLINSAIGKLNSIKVTIPGWVPFVGGKTFGLSLPKIPTLATGGVVLPRSGGVPAILAEAGEAEAVLPLSKLDRMLRTAAAQGRIGGDGATGTGGALRIENYYAASSSDPQRTADALMFLAKARGWRG